MRLQFRIFSLSIFFITMITLASCSKKLNQAVSSTLGIPVVNWWITKADQSALLKTQPPLIFGKLNNTFPTIDIDSTNRMQVIDGFGFSLTGGSAYVINKLDAATKANLLNELFGNDENSIAVSYLRLSIGASDLNETVYSYNDLPAGQTDINLEKFSLSQDTIDVIPVLKEILAINPNIRIMGSPWSPPVWMKDNKNSVGGSLMPQYYPVYAKYFVKYIQAMKAHGITIDAITVQNEPLHPGNNPSMLMLAPQQAEFVRDHLGPAFESAGIKTKIVIYDHNCDRPDYPISILNDPAAKKFIDGSAFHLYGGDISAMTQVHNAHPDKNLYFTEQWTGSKESFDGNLKWHIKNVIIGSMRNWSKIALEWNLANDPNFKPHTPGGCTECKGGLTIGSTITRNPAYYIVAHASKFVPPGSVRIGSNISGNLHNVAFLTPENKKVVIVLNEEAEAKNFNIRFNGKWTTTSLPPGTVGTFVW